ncbi:Uncharacterised protein [Achromobacter spanius]|uniref:hypothetical protein n=1 Tax=Achromobacter spanius TaxID=217203 RepID=UPI000C2BA08C|nr:hypothetical protein [Achromobacter spanius]AUA58881.1 hypothetical protein CVS48_24440 [Achromobacter spanius]CAB3673432.1 hypothetical protein LMG5911_03600 [Achromobacter spanius]SPT38740.1 Uncharacterised protein [Achromobacter denitrificans]VEE58958.1 Uncharacterised protein [Achromobacter spanius]
MKGKIYPRSYRDFMRARRPELYSDTVQVEVSEMDRRQFEFHLASLTSRKEETPFENFARVLAERELCPNLLPQTGPTGGGDSKVDTETYPVARAIANLWYEGLPEATGLERWAFAVSAKAKWKPKLDSDVAKIVATARPYSLVYFITNQAVRDKDRAETQEALKDKYGIEVRIMDRTWIVDRVVTHKRWDIVSETLQFELSTRLAVKHGPLDVARMRELDELDIRIEAAAQTGATLEVVEEALQAALLSRGLERSRVEVDGRFLRAERLAREAGSLRQVNRIWYQQAWTAIWWYDDATYATRIYENLAAQVLPSDWVWDIEPLVNLWLALQSSPLFDQSGTLALRQALDRHASDRSRATSSLWARTLLLFMEFVAVGQSGADPSSTLRGMRQNLSEVRRLLEFPVDTLVRFARNISEVIADSPSLDELMEAIIELEQARNGARSAGELHLQRGMRKLDLQKPYDAINNLAKAQFLLAQEETRDEFIAATVGTGLAFESAGLLYAARGTLVGALDRCLYTHFKLGAADKRALPIVKKLIWVEMQLGRVPYVLAWLSLIPAIHAALSIKEEKRQEFESELQAIDTVLGIILLRTSKADWHHLVRLPDVLSHHGLELSRSAALFMLGQEELVKREYQTADADLQEFYSSWVHTSAAEDLPLEPIWHIGTAIYKTVLLGCHLSISVRGPALSAMLAESFLGFFESFYSTAIQSPGLVSPRSELHIEVMQAEVAKPPFQIEISEDDCGETRLIVKHPVLAPAQLLDNGFSEAMMLLFAHLTYEMQLERQKDALEEMFSKHRAQDRAYQVATSIIPLTNLFGDSPKYRAEDWVGDPMLVEYEMIRESTWSPAVGSPHPTFSPTDEKLNMELGEPPKELFGADAIKHKELQVMSPINMPLWDKARWRGVGSGTLGILGAPPLLMLAFTNIDAGRKIFRGWRKRVGGRDKEGWIGLTIIRGINRDSPLDYRIAIGIGERYVGRQTRPAQRFLMVHRMHDMHPDTSKNLDLILEGYARTTAVLIVPCEFQASRPGVSITREDLQHAIELRNLDVVDAWDVGVHSHILAAMQGISDPLVPPDVRDPPYFAALERMRELKASRNG